MKVHQIACVSALWWLQEPVDGLRHDPGRPTQPAASSALPSRADGWFELAHRGARARFRYRDALQVPGAPLGAGRSGMVYAGGLGAGTVVEVVEVGGGLKDSVVLPAAPSGGRIAYSIDLGNLSGLRAVDGVTELLDAGGTPRLRVGRPIVTDANGVVRPVRVAIRGCAFDSDPRAPWGRPVVPPGARTCSLELSLPEDLAFPATVDPLWGPTGAMIDARVGSRQGENTPLVLIESGPLAGKVLAMGGVSSVPTSLPDPTSNVLAAAELFDPVTETWAATAPLPSARKSHIHAFVELPAGPFVLVAGGCPESLSCTAQAQSWIYDTTTGTWSNTAGPHVAPRGYSRAVRLDDGRVLVMGGFASGAFLSSAELFDPQAGTWTSAASMNAARVRFGFTRLFDGRVLVAGGGGIGTELGDGEVYDPVTNTWSPTLDLVIPRFGPECVEIAPGRVLVLGGGNQLAELSEAELWDASTNAFSLEAETQEGRVGLTAGLLPNGFAYAYGGYSAEGLELYDPASQAWSMMSYVVPYGFRNPGSVRLLDGRVLVAGGASWESFPNATAQTFLIALDPLGAPCDRDAACTSGHCADGVCCDQECAGACSACTAALKASGLDGTCGVVAEGYPDPRSICVDASHACGQTGLCGPQGACATVAQGESCATCPLNHLGVCDGDGVCVCTGARCLDDAILQTPDGTTASCSPYRCVEDDCTHTCNSSSECAPNHVCTAERRCVFAGVPFEPGGSDEDELAVSGGACSAAPRGAGGSWVIGLALALAMRRRSVLPLRSRVGTVRLGRGDGRIASRSAREDVVTGGRADRHDPVSPRAAGR